MSSAIASLAFLILIAGNAFGSTLRIEGGPQPIVDASILYGCIAYQDCNLTTYAITGDQVTITTSVSAREAAEDFARCELGRVQVASISVLKSDGSSTPLAIPHDPGRKLDLAPAVLSDDDLRKIIATASKYAGQPESEVLRPVLRGLGISTHGYTLKLNGIDAAGITHADTKTVDLADGTVDGRFVEALLHEFTHVQQWRRFDHCFGEMKGTFDSQNRRERAAYLEGMQIDQAITTPYSGGTRRKLLDGYDNSDD